MMIIQTTFSKARSNLARLLDQVTANREIVVIERRGAEPVALIAATELSGLLEVAHLLRSPANAQRLLTALARVPEQVIPPLEYLVDETGHKKAVQIDFDAWEQMLVRLNALEDEVERLEEAEDVRAALEVEARIAAGEEPVYSHEEVWAELTEEMEEEALNREMDEATSSPLLTREQALVYLDQD
jgi:antitoxin YefM